MNEHPFPYDAIEFQGGKRVDPEASLREPVDPEAPLGRQTAYGTPVLGNPERRARYRRYDERLRDLNEQALKLSAEGKSGAEILAELNPPNHSV